MCWPMCSWLRRVKVWKYSPSFGPEETGSEPGFDRCHMIAAPCLTLRHCGAPLHAPVSESLRDSSTYTPSDHWIPTNHSDRRRLVSSSSKCSSKQSVAQTTSKSEPFPSPLSPPRAYQQLAELTYLNQRTSLSPSEKKKAGTALYSRSVRLSSK